MGTAAHFEAPKPYRFAPPSWRPGCEYQHAAGERSEVGHAWVELWVPEATHRSVNRRRHFQVEVENGIELCRRLHLFGASACLGVLRVDRGSVHDEAPHLGSTFVTHGTSVETLDDAVSVASGSFFDGEVASCWVSCEADAGAMLASRGGICLHDGWTEERWFLRRPAITSATHSASLACDLRHVRERCG